MVCKYTTICLAMEINKMQEFMFRKLLLHNCCKLRDLFWEA